MIELRKAIEIAEEIKERFFYVTNRIEIAGSVRRRKSLCKDIEIVVIPKYEKREYAVDMFSNQLVAVNLLDEYLQSHTDLFMKRPNKNGIYAYGSKNKLMLYNDIPVDIFTADESNFEMVKFIRTGSAIHNAVVAKIAIDKGYRLKMYESGFKNGWGDIIRIKSEKEIYSLLEMDYIPPLYRNEEFLKLKYKKYL